MDISKLRECRQCKSKKAIKIGTRFGNLVTISEQKSYQDIVPNKNGKINRHVLVECICDCNSRTTVRRQCLLTKHTKSCGCQQVRSMLENTNRSNIKSTKLINDEKRCSSCMKFKNKELYHNHHSTNDKLTHWCKECYRLADIKRKFGVSKEDFESMMASCNNSCEICKSEFTEVNPQIDHDHITGKVRGLLCLYCNLGLRKGVDNINSLGSMKNYISVGEFNFTNKKHKQNYIKFSNSQLIKIKYKYKCSKNMLAELLNYQEGNCGICKIKLLEDRSTCVDHDHKNNYVRGILCNNCNSSLGYFKESLEIIDNAITYLANHEISS